MNFCSCLQRILKFFPSSRDGVFIGGAADGCIFWGFGTRGSFGWALSENSAEFLFDLAWRHHHRRGLHETSSQTTSSRAKIEEEASMKKRSRPSGESDTLDLRFACLALMKSSSKAQHSPPQLRNCSNFLHRDHHRSMSGAAVAEYRSLA